MKKRRLLSLLMAAVLSVSSLWIPTAAAAETVAQSPSENLIANGDFSKEPTIQAGERSSDQNTWFGNAGVKGEETYTQKITWNDGYLTFSERTKNTRFFYYNGDFKVTPGTYTISFKVKTANAGERSNIRFAVTNMYTEKTPIAINDQWKTVSADFTNEKMTVDFQFEFYGGMNATDIHDICIDDFTLIRNTVITPPPPEDNRPLSLKEPLPEGNVIEGGDFNTKLAVNGWATNTQKLIWVEDANGGYVEVDKLITNYHGFKYSPSKTVPAGKYKFTVYVRCADPGEKTHLRIRLYDKKNNSILMNAYPGSDEWMKVESYVTLENNLDYIHFGGGPSTAYMQEYCIDNISMVPVDTIPEGGFVENFGEYVSSAAAIASNMIEPEAEYDKYDKEAEGYEIQGVVINQDADSFIGGVVNCTEEQIIEFAKMYRDTHVTDFVACLNNTNSTYPSDVWDDLLDKYHQTEENGQPVDYKNVAMMKGAHYLYEVLKSDYIALWMDAFREVGINPWISMRMNDAHDMGKETSHLLSDYYHNNPQIRRVQDGPKFRYGELADYTHKSHRDRVLAYLDEALGRYDCYGLELDFQRQLYFWYYGGEYNGLDIMNQFMRDLDAIIAKHEAERGHEIKLNVCVAHDIQTNYDFGLDVMTWVEEGIVDMVTPKGMNVQNNDIPVAQWKSMLEPYGTLIAPALDMWLKGYSTGVESQHTFETFTAGAANFLSQGADRVYMYNFYLGLSNKITDADRITTTDGELSVKSMKGYHNVISTVGSYDKLMTVNRRVVSTYVDTIQVWKGTTVTTNMEVQFPKLLMAGKSAIFRIQAGDIPEGAEVTFRIASSGGTKEGKYPVVKINGVTCNVIGTDYFSDSSKEEFLLIEVPAEVYNQLYLTAEITATEYMAIDAAEVYIKAPENAVAPKKASNTPSSWAEAEVTAAIEAGIFPWSMRSDYTDTVTRREFCTLIMAMINKVAGVSDSRELLDSMGIAYVDSFTDTDSADVIAANLLGIVNGRGNGIFDPMSGITRQEAAKMLASAAAVLGIKAGTAPEFKDMDKAADWAVESINTTASIVSASGKNVMGGVGDGMFSPLGAYTREQSVLTVYRLFDSIVGEAKPAALGKVEVTEAERYVKASPAEVKPEGVSGIVLRANSDEIDVSALKGSQVTEVILTLGDKDATDVIKAIRSSGIRVYVAVNSGAADKEAESVLKKYDVNGIEVDYLSGFGVIDFANTYKNLAEETEMLRRLAKITDTYAAKYGHSVRVSVRVASDIMTNYYIGLDLTRWAQDGLVDIICPSSIDVHDSDISARLWYSIFNAYDVEIAPVIGDTAKTRAADKTVLAMNSEAIAGAALNMLSKGVDKVSVYYSAVDSASLKVLGSYDTLINTARRTLPTYTDVRTPWQPEDNHLPIAMGKGSLDVIFLPVGDCAEGQSMTLRFAFIGSVEAAREGMSVYANSELCKYVGKSEEVDPLTGYTLYSFEVPEKAINSGHLFIAIRADGGMINLVYADAYVK